VDKTLLKGLSVLECLLASEAHCSIDEVAEAVGLTRSNAHRTLQTLVHAGYLERDRVNGGYKSTLKVFALGARRLGRLDLYKIAPDFMTTLARETGETIHLAVPDGKEVVYIDKIDSRQAIGAYATIGGRAPSHASATGKALLAALGPEGLASLRDPLERHTDLTIRTLTALSDDLAQARRRGYAVDKGEWREGVGGVAVPTFNAFGKPVAALGVCGPITRLTPGRIKEIAPRLLSIGLSMSRALGYLHLEA
jgi:IclR family KDG regulon transcriptional repressor